MQIKSYALEGEMYLSESNVATNDNKYTCITCILYKSSLFLTINFWNRFAEFMVPIYMI